ncbi:class I SAM-dependent methyltransferase [Pelagibacterium montanilacus]|uniref:class I SAM-dependent methyltransferase n=1 Tax=Pelagibacterium montanilacus TaxID=2185280 RepID=UPI000F8F29F4|nr:class I SAM-dependent methyltransferase [Pelagibacterium montanilacus]
MSEPSSDAIIGLYERHADAWERVRQRATRPPGEEVWVGKFASLAVPGARLLDLGCGSGEPIAADLHDAGFAVTGVDASPSLISACRRRLPDHEWIVADMRTLDLGCRFGGIIAWHSIFHLTPGAQREMFSILVRHLAPGAPLMFTSGPRHGVSMGTWQGEPLYHASLDAQSYTDLLVQSGMKVVDHVVEDPECGGATVWLAVSQT